MEEKFSDREQIMSRIERVSTGDEVPEKAPLVSVIVPVHNLAGLIAETLDSIFAQGFEDFEVVLVNDGSSDTEQLEKALEPYMARLVYAVQSNTGCSAARNAAMILARGEYFAYLDGDDIWLPDFLSSQLEYLKQNELEMVYCNAELFGDNFYNADNYMATAPSNGEANLIALLKGECNVITSGTIVTRDCLEKFGLFDHRSVRAQDFDLWIRLASNGTKIGYQRKILLRYRVSSSSLSGTNVERAQRGVTILEFVRDKYDFEGATLAALESQLGSCRVEVEVEQAKLNLVQGNYDQARAHLGNADRLAGKLKFKILAAILGLAPGVVLGMFRKYRSREYAFIVKHSE